MVFKNISICLSEPQLRCMDEKNEDLKSRNTFSWIKLLGNEHLCSTRGTTFQHSQKEIIVLKKTSPQQEKIPFYVSFNWQLIWRPCGGCSCQLWPSAVLIHRCLQPWLDAQLTTVWEYSCPLFWTSTVSWFEPLFSAITVAVLKLCYSICCVEPQACQLFREPHPSAVTCCPIGQSAVKCCPFGQSAFTCCPIGPQLIEWRTPTC